MADLIARSALPERDPNGAFSIDIDTGGLCVGPPVPPQPCVGGDVNAVETEGENSEPPAVIVDDLGALHTRVDAAKARREPLKSRASTAD